MDTWMYTVDHTLIIIHYIHILLTILFYQNILGQNWVNIQETHL